MDKFFEIVFLWPLTILQAIFGGSSYNPDDKDNEYNDGTDYSGPNA